jgi:hypothetical protein
VLLLPVSPPARLSLSHSQWVSPALPEAPWKHRPAVIISNAIIRAYKWEHYAHLFPHRREQLAKHQRIRSASGWQRSFTGASTNLKHSHHYLDSSADHTIDTGCVTPLTSIALLRPDLAIDEVWRQASAKR